jgi:SAM-dependent methyltransferase
MTTGQWSAGEAYDGYIGRWSRKVAVEFIRWLNLPVGQHWLDVGSGTGALAATILAMAEPADVVGVDPSAGFLATAQASTPAATFRVGDARELPVADRSVDVVVSGLTMNFVPEPDRAMAEFLRVSRPGATLAAYVWDYAEGMALLRFLWDAATDLNPHAAELDEGPRFPLCKPEGLRRLWTDHALTEVSVEPIVVPTPFRNFDDYWSPFLGGQGPAGAYVSSLADEDRTKLQDLLRSRLPAEPDGSIALTARAWAVRGVVPHSSASSKR